MPLVSSFALVQRALTAAAMVEDTGGVDAAMLEARQKMIAKRFGGGAGATVGGACRNEVTVARARDYRVFSHHAL